MTTIADVRALYETERTRLADLDAKLAAEYKKIDNDAFDANRPMTEAERNRRTEINTQRGEIGKQLQALSFSTLDGLRTASDVDSLIAGIEAANAQLDGTLQHLKQMEAYAEDAAMVAKGLSSIVDGLTKLRPSLI